MRWSRPGGLRYTRAMSFDTARRLRPSHPGRAIAGALALLLGLLGASRSALAEGGVAASAARSRVHPNAESIQPLAVGQRVPSAQLRTIDGAGVDVATLTKERGALLVFYRGGW